MYIIVHNNQDSKSYWNGRVWEHSSRNRPKVYMTLAGARKALRMFEGFTMPEIEKVG